MNVTKLMVEGTKILSNHKDVEEFEVVGSCLFSAAPKDVDFLVLLKPNNEDSCVRDPMSWVPNADAWTFCGEYDDQDGTWQAIRLDSGLNLIVTSSQAFFTGMVAASHVCHALQLVDKKSRVIVHRIVRDGMTAEEALLSVQHKVFT